MSRSWITLCCTEAKIKFCSKIWQIQLEIWLHFLLEMELVWVERKISAPLDYTFTFSYSYSVCVSGLRLTSRRRCCGCPAGWWPRGPTAWLRPARRWAASPPEGPNLRRCCCRRRRSPGRVRAPPETRRTRSRRRQAACHGRPPSPLRWSLRGKRGTDRKRKNKDDVSEHKRQIQNGQWGRITIQCEKCGCSTYGRKSKKNIMISRECVCVRAVGQRKGKSKLKNIVKGFKKVQGKKRRISKWWEK